VALLALETYTQLYLYASKHPERVLPPQPRGVGLVGLSSNDGASAATPSGAWVAYGDGGAEAGTGPGPGAGIGGAATCYSAEVQVNLLQQHTSMAELAAAAAARGPPRSYWESHSVTGASAPTPSAATDELISPSVTGDRGSEHHHQTSGHAHSPTPAVADFRCAGHTCTVPLPEEACREAAAAQASRLHSVKLELSNGCSCVAGGGG
jgi:hypothetical protein